MPSPLFSCVVPVKGARPYMAVALESLRSQGVGDALEIIVQDADVEPDSGQSDALNKGFAKSTGEWLFWLNADDILLPGALKSVKAKIESFTCRNVEWIAGDTVYIDETDRVAEVRTDAKWYPWFGKRMSVWTGGPSAFFKRELWERSGGFDVRLKYVMDIDLWTRWAKSGVRFESLGRYIWGFRVHAGSKTASGKNINAHLDEKKSVLARHCISKPGFWRNITRACSLMNGCWIKRVSDSRKYRGIHWNDIHV